MREIRANFTKLASHFQPLHDCKPFSRQAFNAISATVLESLYTCIQEIDAFAGEIPYHTNIALILYNDFHVAACQHYFQEYERLCGFVDSRPAPGRVVSRPREALFSRGTRKGAGKALNSVDKFALGAASLVGWVGNTTFPWQSLAFELRAERIRLVPAEASLALSILAFSRQIEIMEAGVDDLGLGR